MKTPNRSWMKKLSALLLSTCLSLTLLGPSAALARASAYLDMPGSSSTTRAGPSSGGTYRPQANPWTFWRWYVWFRAVH